MPPTEQPPRDGTEIQPLVSVVVPAYNNADFLDATIQSVIAQSYKNLEIIIADHASTDATWQVMQGYRDEPRVQLLRTEPGGGAKQNWDRVSQAATGEFLKLVCGDDLLHPQIIERQVAAFEASPSAVLVSCRRSIVDANGETIMKGRGLSGMTGRHSGVAAIRSTVRQGTNIFGEPGCVLMRRAILESTGWWDSRWPYLIDEATYAQVLLHGDFVGVDAVLASFRISAGQWSVRLTKDQAAQATGFHDWLHSTKPSVVRRSDRLIGNLRARAMARARRLVYVWLGRRMTTDSSQPVTPGHR